MLVNTVLIDKTQEERLPFLGRGSRLRETCHIATKEPHAPFHVGLTAQQVIDAACALTEEVGLRGWSVRDLAHRLGVSASVIYHHVGGRELITRQVVDRVLAELAVPLDATHWRDFFRRFLFDNRPLIAHYRGVAHWLLMHGPTFTSVLPVIDTGIRLLKEAGFGEDAGLAYAALLNNAMLTLSMSDDRLDHDVDGPRDHATLMADFQRIGEGSPGVAELSRSLVVPFVSGAEDAERQRGDYFRFIVETTIAGLDARLAGSSPPDALS